MAPTHSPWCMMGSPPWIGRLSGNFIMTRRSLMRSSQNLVGRRVTALAVATSAVRGPAPSHALEIEGIAGVVDDGEAHVPLVLLGLGAAGAGHLLHVGRGQRGLGAHGFSLSLAAPLRNRDAPSSPASPLAEPTPTPPSAATARPA